MIYFIIQEGYRFVKIGYTENEESLEKRIAGMQTGNPHALKLLTTCEGTRDTEKVLHDLFRKHHVRGEWYDCGPILGDIVSVNKAVMGVLLSTDIERTHAYVLDLVHGK